MSINSTYGYKHPSIFRKENKILKTTYSITTIQIVNANGISIHVTNMGKKRSYFDVSSLSYSFNIFFPLRLPVSIGLYRAHKAYMMYALCPCGKAHYVLNIIKCWISLPAAEGSPQSISPRSSRRLRYKRPCLSWGSHLHNHRYGRYFPGSPPKSPHPSW